MGVKPSMGGNPLAGLGKNPFLGLIVVLTLLLALGYASLSEFPKHRETTLTVWYVDTVPSPYDLNAADGIDGVIQVAYKSKLTGDRILLFVDSELVRQLKAGHRYELKYHCVERVIGHNTPWILDSYNELESG